MTKIEIERVDNGFIVREVPPQRGPAPTMIGAVRVYESADSLTTFIKEEFATTEIKSGS